ncbi:hypothetical protein EMCG_05168 [[Emmonsia] crescens]|uniref:Uncharacterized protein n=1 Tax=[Emmonsia] crescens TaxID=73230 RepID=A0A0G2HQU6_9EURO|nr:hypothetical protein EMCG_05168 [Emmonsia crescens UAMH 3008]
MDMVRQMYKIALNDQLLLAPIRDDPQHVLDMGTRTCISAMECAECVTNHEYLFSA